MSQPCDAIELRPVPPAVNARPPRRSRCASPRAVRCELVRVVHDLRDGRLDPQQGNAMINGLRVVLSAITEAETEERIAQLEQTVARAIATARSDA